MHVCLTKVVMNFGGSLLCRYNCLFINDYLQMYMYNIMWCHYLNFDAVLKDCHMSMTQATLYSIMGCSIFVEEAVCEQKWRNCF